VVVVKGFVLVLDPAGAHYKREIRPLGWCINATTSYILSAEEMAQYRRPFAEPGEGRRPTLTWPRQIPIDGEPPVDLATSHVKRVQTSPKLAVYFE
jgi:hypothetical protein